MRQSLSSAPALAEAVALLQRLPRDRHAVRTARREFDRFRDDHPGVAARLVTSQPPASNDVDFDLLLTEPDQGTLSLSWNRDDGVPWSGTHAEHWAANSVLTVNGADTSIQSALIYLNAVLNRRPDYMADLIDRSIVWAAIEANPPEIDEAEVDEAVAAFKARQGLTDAAALRRWLDEMQLTPESLRHLVVETVQIRAFKRALVADRVQPWFDAHAEDFAPVTVLLVRASSAAIAVDLAEAWRRTGQCPALSASEIAAVVETKLETAHARDLPPVFASAPQGAIVGPVEDGWIGQVVGRAPARLDAETRAAIEKLLFDEWLAGQRRAATIRWHWV